MPYDWNHALRTTMCRVVGHNWKPSTLEDWQRTGFNFRCARCGNGAKRAWETHR